MNVEEAIEKRRAYRSLEPIEITENIVDDLAKSLQLTPSCYNNQPWRFVFVYEQEKLRELHSALSRGNEWAHSASMIIAVASKKDLDCVLKDREYHLFDIGMGSAFVILRATELGLVAHPIAGYDEDKAKQILNIPEDMQVITLIVVGKHSNTINPALLDMQANVEKERPERLALEKFAFKNSFGK